MEDFSPDYGFDEYCIITRLIFCLPGAELCILLKSSECLGSTSSPTFAALSLCFFRIHVITTNTRKDAQKITLAKKDVESISI